MNHRTKLAALAAVMSLTPTGAVQAAEAGDNVLRGTVILPDGSPAQAAVVDLAVTVGGVAREAFARAVTDTDGRFRELIPATDELQALASLNNGVLEFQATITDLVQPIRLPGSKVDAYQLVQSGKAVLDKVQSIGDRPQPVFDIDDLTHDTFATAELALSTIKQAAAAIGNGDPDMLMGNDNVDDPDLVPPLGAQLLTLPGTLLPDTALTDQPVEGEPHGGDCARVNQTYWWTTGGKGTQPPDGLDWYIYLIPYRCKDKDPDRDFVLYAWEGKGVPHGPESDNDPDYWSMFRLKYRTEAYPQSDYYWQRPAPKTDTYYEDGGAVNWSVGYSNAGFSGGISGTFPMAKKTKNHPWQDTRGKLLHSSWLSKNSAGMAGEIWNEMGWLWEMPQSSGVHYHDIQVQVWRCHHVYSMGRWKDTCDKK